MMETSNKQTQAENDSTFAGGNSKAKLITTGSKITFENFMDSLRRHLAGEKIEISTELQESLNKFIVKTQKECPIVGNHGEKRKATTTIKYKVLSAEEVDNVEELGLDAEIDDLLSCMQKGVPFLFTKTYMLKMVECILKLKDCALTNNANGDGDPHITCRDFIDETNLLSKDLKIKMNKVKLPLLWALIQLVWEFTRSMSEVRSFIEGTSVWNKIELLVNTALIHKPEDAVEVGRFDNRFNRRNLKLIYSINKIEQMVKVADLEKSIPKVSKRKRDEGVEGLALYAGVKRSRSDSKLEEEEDIKLMDITSTGYQPYCNDKKEYDNKNGCVIVFCSPRSGIYLEKIKQRKSDQQNSNHMEIDDENEMKDNHDTEKWPLSKEDEEENDEDEDENDEEEDDDDDDDEDDDEKTTEKDKQRNEEIGQTELNV